MSFLSTSTITPKPGKQGEHLWTSRSVGTDKNTALDLVRGLAALMVCVGHIRNFVFVDFDSLNEPTILEGMFYFLTGLGHQAVIVFFVLSGYFVGGSVWKQITLGRFRWIDYTITRLTRLWVVLIPALLVTWVGDSLGGHFAGSAGYDGRWHQLLSSGPGTGSSANDLSLLTFLGNTFFLQTIWVPVFGINGPLWSLANEFWYYVWFPFLALTIHRRIGYSILGLTGVGLLLIQMPFSIQSGFVFWLMGWLVAVFERRLMRTRWYHIVGTVGLLISALIANHFLNGFIGEMLVGLAFVALLLGLSGSKIESRWFTVGCRRLSEMSFSLYLFHFPFLGFVWYVFLAPAQSAPSLIGFAQFFALLFGSLSFSYVAWWFFERHTNQARYYLTNLLGLTK